MGLLDDAIREHLELKRRRGADPGEVARQEEEALGDPRAPQPGADLGDVEAPEPGFEPDPELEGDEPEDLLPGEPLPEEAPVPYPAGDEPEVADEPGTDLPGGTAPRDDAPWLEDDALEDRRREPDPDPPTAEQEPAPSSPAQEGDEDVLEDTPDFLQDTPEHDRLWFEQRPPRDFDFDS
jgi:hypothetical protein